MADIMEKEALLEIIVEVLAMVIHRTPPDSTNNEDIKYLKNLRLELLSTHHDKIDYKNLVDKVKNIKEKYKDLPIHPYYE